MNSTKPADAPQHGRLSDRLTWVILALIAMFGVAGALGDR
jgi:hypothetical protein